MWGLAPPITGHLLIEFSDMELWLFWCSKIERGLIGQDEDVLKLNIAITYGKLHVAMAHMVRYASELT